jgi:hypothetical protein
VSDSGGRRVGLNEALFREVNERMEKLSGDFGSPVGELRCVCECADGSCIEQFEVPISEYERLRSDPLLFVVAPGHEVPEMESVVFAAREYEIVRKRDDEARRVAKSTDPRSDRT